MAAGQKIRGLVGQGMGRRAPRARIRQLAYKTTLGAAILSSPPYATTVEAWLVGGGGGNGGTGGSGGGGGGEAVWVRFVCPPSFALVHSVGGPGALAPGTDGGDTSINLPTGQIIKATGGKTGVVGTGGKGGGFTGQLSPNEIHHAGGDGGSTSQAGSPGFDGGLGGAANGSDGGGGGSGGFASFGDLVSGGGGAVGATSDAGLGGGGTHTRLAGGGLLVAVFTRISQI